MRNEEWKEEWNDQRNGKKMEMRNGLRNGMMDDKSNNEWKGMKYGYLERGSASSKNVKSL